MEKNQLALRIRGFRKLKGHTQTEFAKRVGVSVSVLGAIERGNRMPDGKLLEKMAKVLEVGKDELLSPPL